MSMDKQAISFLKTYTGPLVDDKWQDHSLAL
jgi:hypothetical protein